MNGLSVDRRARTAGHSSAARVYRIGLRIFYTEISRLGGDYSARVPQKSGGVGSLVAGARHASIQQTQRYLNVTDEELGEDWR
jgi:hypothetical protein